MDISKAVALKVTRIRTTFTDDIGNTPRTGTGTAFWLKTSEGVFLLLTSRHLLDPLLLSKDPEGWKLTSVEVELRWVEDEDSDNPTKGRTKFLKVSEPGKRIFMSRNDCAFLADPFDERPEMWAHQGMSHFHEADLASDEWLDEALLMLDPVFFIGFPNTWWDQQRILPIARMAHLASMENFHNDGIKTDDVCLVTGLSFGGSSGSPVVSYPKEEDLGSFGKMTIPPRLLGIMSGHFPFKDHDAPGFPLHAGLSYFTRSNSIITLIEEARAKGFKKTH